LVAPISAHAGGGNGAARPVVVVPVPVPVPAPNAPVPAQNVSAPAAPVVPAPASRPAAPAASAPAPATAPAAAGATAAVSKLPAPKTPLEAAVQQVVMLERAGRPIAVGIPLNGDGRILTALSPLTHGNQIMARYPEGQVIPVKLSHSDRAWDLALLTPLGDARRSGLKASHEPAPAAGSKLHALNYVQDKKLGSTDLTLKTKGTRRGGDGAQLVDSYELSPAPKPADMGAPLVNDQGEVVALIARACSVNDKAGCTLAPYAAPVNAVRDFLRAAPARKGPWLGVDVVAFDAGFARGVRVAAVAPEGPAASSGLRAGPPGVGDVVLAVDGKPVASTEAFVDAVETRDATGPARLTVLSEGRYREVLLTGLGPPDPPAPVPVRNDRVIRSNNPGPAPSPGPWPTPAPPGSVPNPYR